MTPTQAIDTLEILIGAASNLDMENLEQLLNESKEAIEVLRAASTKRQSTRPSKQERLDHKEYLQEQKRVAKASLKKPNKRSGHIT